MKIAQGAEAKVYLEGQRVVKKRVKKSYRISAIDSRLRVSRTRREAKVLDRLLSIGLHVPKLFKTSAKSASLEMEYINGEKLGSRDLEKCTKMFKKVGEMTGKMHSNDIIHGDLTTSNMIFSGNQVYFIDFGLSFFSDKTEDKAVDLHLFKQSLNKASNIATCLSMFMQGYKKQYKNYREIFSKLERVEKRGRNKSKIT